jgi:glutaredoxin
MTTLELYDRQDCPYSRLVRNTLEKLELDYEETVVPDDHADRTEVENRTGQTGVPVLFDDNHEDGFIADSTEIVAYLQETYE